MNATPHREREHSRYSASAAERWMNCPGSVRLCEDAPERRSSYADEGTQAHELLEAMLLDRMVSAPGALALVRAKCPQDMIDAVQIAFDYVCDILDTTPGYGLTIEKRFTLPSRIAPGEVFGTADVTIYDPTARKLWVLDYKHGSGVPVEAVGSKQLRFYALGCVTAEPWRRVDSVEMVIMQPRAFHALGPIRSEVIDFAELVDFYGEIEEAINMAQLANTAYEEVRAETDDVKFWGNHYLLPSTSACRWCPAAPACPARQSQALALVGEDFKDVRQVTAESLPPLGDLTPDRIGQILAMKDLVEDWLDKVEKHAIDLVKAGVFIPGRKLVEPVGRRSYNAPGTVAGRVAEILRETARVPAGIEAQDFCEPPTPLGVTAMEKKIKETAKPYGKEVMRAALDAFALLTTKKSSGNLTLVAESDPRPAINPAQNAFGGIVDIPQIQMEQ